MNIGIKDLIMLDDNNEYVVASKVNYACKNYYYIMDIKNNKNVKFCYENNDSLIEINDNNLISKLLPLFLNVIKNEF